MQLSSSRQPTARPPGSAGPPVQPSARTTPQGAKTPRALVIARRLILRSETGGFVSACVVFAFFAVAAHNNGFLSQTGTSDWINTSSQLGILALPVGLLMMAGEFDLSVGAVVGATSIVVAICHGYYSLSPWIGIIISVAIGIAVGLLNGIITVSTRLPSFVVTLAMMLMVDGGSIGVANWLTGASSISAIPEGPSRLVFASSWHSFDVSLIWWVVLAAVATYILQQTQFGNWILATGGNQQAARLAGVPTGRVKVALFVATSLGAVLVGIIETLSFSNGNVTLGSDYVFTAIAAAVIGGVLLSGGYGSMLGTVFGSITYGVASMGVFFLGWDADLTDLFIGLFLLLAVLANNQLRRLALGRSEWR
jgi:simple sugar transport system permease protein